MFIDLAFIPALAISLGVPLFKARNKRNFLFLGLLTALFAADPNWGRILAAVGRSGPADLGIEGVSINLDECCLARNGGLAAEYDESVARAIMEGEEYTLLVTLGRGDREVVVWTCDLSHEYIRINAEYRT